MKQLLSPKNLPWFALGAGAVGAILRAWLLLGGVDDKGMLISGHPAEILCWILCAVSFAIMVLGSWNLLEAGKYQYNFPASLPGAIGAGAAAVGVLYASICDLLAGGDTLVMIGCSLGFAAAISLGFLAWLRKNGQRPNVLFHFLVCLHLMFRVIAQYRVWSSDPQIQNYCFQLLALVCLMVSTYQRATFDAKFGMRRAYTVLRLLCVFFCILCLPGAHTPLFYLTAAAWAFTDQCNLTPMPRKTKEQEDETA